MLDDTDILIRSADIADVPEIRRILVTIWHDTYDPIMGREEVSASVGRFFPEVYLEMLARPKNSLSWLGVATDGDRIVGVAHAQVSIFGTLKITTLYILPSHQRLGIGAHFLRAIAARFAFARTVKVESLAANRRAIQFYQSQGFVVEGVLTRPADIRVPIAGLTQTVPGAASWLTAAKWYVAELLRPSDRPTGNKKAG